MTNTSSATGLDLERQDLLRTLAKRRDFLRQTARGLTDEQAASCPTVSALCIGGLIKHVSSVEEGWRRFILEGPGALMSESEVDYAEYALGFKMAPGETLAGLLQRYEEVAAETDSVIAELASLDLSHPLPEAPWFEPGASWSARTVIVHIMSETAHHSGHADIIRETIDGAKTMG